MDDEDDERGSPTLPSGRLAGLGVPGSIVDSAVASHRHHSRTTSTSSQVVSTPTASSSTNAGGTSGSGAHGYARAAAGSPAVLNVASGHNSEPLSAIRRDVIPPELVRIQLSLVLHGRQHL